MKSPGISACIITKNEEHNLPDCLDSLKLWVDEICLADTGSTDGTVALAEEYGCKVSLVDWNDSFADARNASLDMAEKEWILVIDADERLQQGCGPLLRQLIGDQSSQAYLIYQDNPVSQGGVQSIAIPRLFRNRKEIRFSRKVHESVMESLIELSYGQPDVVDVHLNHVGYSVDQIQHGDKNERNKRLLRLELDERPSDLFAHYKFAQTLTSPQERHERGEVYEKAVILADSIPPGERLSYPFLPLVYEGYASQLVDEGKISQAMKIVQQQEGAYPQLPEIVWRKADLCWRAGDFETAMNLFQHCMGLPAHDPRIPSDSRLRNLAARSRLGDIALELGDPDSFFQLMGEIHGSDELSIHCRVQQVRALLLTEETEKAMEKIYVLASDFPASTEVLLLQGQIALLQENNEKAEQFFINASDYSDAGQRAGAMRMLMALRKGNVDSAAKINENMVVRELRTASINVLLCVLQEKEVFLDQAFISKYIVQKLAYWLSQLVEQGDSTILKKFMVSSKHYQEQFPGIDELLVMEE